MPNEFVREYEEHEALRRLVHSKLRAGDLTREEVAAIVALPNLDGEAPAAARATALLAEHAGR